MMSEDNELMTVSEVANKIVRCDGATVRRWLKQGALEAILLPHVGSRRAYRIRRSTIDTMLNTGSLAGVS